LLLIFIEMVELKGYTLFMLIDGISCSLVALFLFVPCLLYFIASFLAWLFTFILYFQSPYIGVAMGITVSFSIIGFLFTLLFFFVVMILIVVFIFLFYKRKKENTE
jgi:hypothetical protein